MNFSIGFIGQGWIGKNYADDFENRGFSVVRYGLEPKFAANKDKIKDCDIVFIAVPTPTTPTGFDDSIVRQVVGLVGAGKIAVIKSTVKPGTTESIQADYPNVLVLHSPEFLVESSAAINAANPFSNIIGLPKQTKEYQVAAEAVLKVLPQAPFVQVCSAQEAELFKYLHNVHGFVEVILMNLCYDLAEKLGARWEVLKDAMLADPMFSNYYREPIHKSGRGAGGHCFIKDFATFRDLHRNLVATDTIGQQILTALEAKNIELLSQSGKDLDLLQGVYGPRHEKSD